MSTTINATLDTRRDAEMAVERLVPEFGVERTVVVITAEGRENSAGVAADGAGRESKEPRPDARADGDHEGAITVTVDLNDDALADRITGTFGEFGRIVEAGN